MPLFYKTLDGRLALDFKYDILLVQAQYSTVQK